MFIQFEEKPMYENEEYILKTIFDLVPESRRIKEEEDSNIEYTFRANNDQIDDQKDVSIRESHRVRGEYLEFAKEGSKQTTELSNCRSQSQYTLGHYQDIKDQNKDIVIRESHTDKGEILELVKEQLTKVKQEIEDQIGNKLPVSKTQLRCMTELMNEYHKKKNKLQREMLQNCLDGTGLWYVKSMRIYQHQLLSHTV